jgi:DNA-binding MarR family transcriptional regulator
MKQADTQAISALVMEVFRLNGRLCTSGDGMVADIGLTSSRFQVLGVIALSSAALSVAQIARNLGVTRQAVQPIVNEMVASGLLELKDNPNHRRSRLVQLTKAGWKVFKLAEERWQRMAAQIMVTHVSRVEVEQATDALQRIRSYLQRRADGKSRRA